MVLVSIVVLTEVQVACICCFSCSKLTFFQNIIVNECRSASYARQLVQKQVKGHKELSPEREPTKLPKGTQLSSDGSGMMQKGEEEGLDALKSKKDKNELSSLVKSIKMKSKQVQLSSDGKTGKHGKSQFKGMGKRRL